jgi:hypothetical protein
VNRRLPPVSALSTVTLVLSVISAILIASNVPHDPPMTIVVALLAAAAGVLAINIVLLSRVQRFAWSSFFLVAKWSLVGYLVIAGMIEFAFLRDSIPGPQLAAMSAMLALFAVDVPLLLGFAVAQHQPAGD